MSDALDRGQKTSFVLRGAVTAYGGIRRKLGKRYFVFHNEVETPDVPDLGTKENFTPTAHHRLHGG